MTNRSVLLRLGGAALATGLALSLVACGGSSGSSSSAASGVTGAGAGGSGKSTTAKAKITSASQVCGLLTTAQVADAVGGQVKDGEQSDEGAPACNWWLVSTAGSGLNVQAGGVSSVTSLATLIKQGMMKGDTAAGIGDEAYWDYALGEDKPALRFIKGGDGFYIAINGSQTPDRKAAETKIANEILAKL